MPPTVSMSDAQPNPQPKRRKSSAARSRQHRRFLEPLRPIADAVAMALGDMCEVLIHDFSNLDSSIIHIAGNVTGRRVGGPLTDLGMALLRQAQVPDILADYTTYTPDGRRLKSSSVFFKDETGVPFGAMCINIDVSKLLAIEAFIQNFTRSERNDDPAGRIQEDFADSSEAVINRIFDRTVSEMGKPVHLMARRDKTDLLHRLDQAGVFSFRKAAEIVAALLGVSRGTVYLYLKTPADAEAGGDAGRNRALLPSPDSARNDSQLAKGGQ